MESILYARLPEDIVVIRVVGRGSHTTSLSLREVISQTSSDTHCPRYIFDLDQCATMDSTFMGLMASLALKERRIAGCKPIVVNMNAHVRQLLTNLGLKHILDMREGPAKETAAMPTGDGAFEQVKAPEVDKVNRIVMMIEAHEKLIDIQGDNEVQFKGVIQSLKESLDRTRNAQS